MEKIRKIFRNPASDIFLILALVISCFILINVADLVSKIIHEEDSTENFKYAQYYIVSGNMDFENMMYLADAADNFKEGNVYLNTLVYLNKSADEIYANIIMQDNEDLMLKFQSGEYKKEQKYNNAMIIGESLANHIIDENGNKYIYLDHNKMNVIGVLENNMAGGVDNSIYILWDTLDKQCKDTILAEHFDLCFKSNKNRVNIYNTIGKEMAGQDIEFVEYDMDYTGAYQNYWYRMYNKVFLSISFVFSVFSCFSVSYLWLQNRVNELAVRMAYGYSTFQIFLLLLKDIVMLLIPTFILTIIVQIFYSMVNGEMGDLLSMFLYKVLIVFGGMFFVVLINAIYLTRKISVEGVHSDIFKADN